MKKRFEYKIFNMPVKKWYGTVDNEEMIKQLNPNFKRVKNSDK